MLKHPDQLDNASEIEMMSTEKYVQIARAKARPEQVQNEDGSWPHEECIDCGVDIPEARLKLGRVRCVDCQEIKEKRDKQRGWG